MSEQAVRDKLIKTRTSLGITHEMIAQQTGLTRPLINQIEQGNWSLQTPEGGTYIFVINAYQESMEAAAAANPTPATNIYEHINNQTAKQKRDFSTARLVALKILNTDPKRQNIRLSKLAQTISLEAQVERQTAVIVIMELRQLGIVKETYGKGFQYTL